MTGFVQIIEFRTRQIDEIRRLANEMRSERGGGGAPRGWMTADRDRPGYYLTVVEFDSYDSAMANSAREDVSAFAARMAALCDEPPRFYNLDVLEGFGRGMSEHTAKAALAGTAAAVAGAAVAGVGKAREQLHARRAHRAGSHAPGTQPSDVSSPTVLRDEPRPPQAPM